ncbi:arabinose ABC transporter substrate-binding protein [Thermoanaerobacterium sp. RBIITD]|uniref:arabinose ABC transporter substrate-binding protein n=1 Tax=Thermoanaerobacterium sp. RBIITD TaxID=1550240 RepID=UPI000BB88ECE|nr:arabinose ABC transporter substrate-binding protein [Thermoanaerobacterium sp. RBIITD]SNX53366.1 L-arabinose transport system substrate-binding protein [Thermoanaerobacterium sp. RBIITD]
MKGKGLLQLGIVMILIISLLVGCGSSNGGKTKNNQSSSQTSDKKNIVIAGIYKAGDQTWFINEGKASEAAAKQMGASKFMFIDAKMNPDTYLQDIDNVIAQKVSGVLTCTPDQKLSKAVVDKLKAANIPVIAVDDALQDENGNKLVPWVGIDAYNIGKTNGEWMANYAKQNGLDKDKEAGLLILTMDTVSSCVPRTKGELEKFKEIIPDFPDSRIFKADYDGQTEKGFNAAAPIFTAHPEIKKWMVMTANEEGAVGATRALEQAGLDKQSVVIGMGAYMAKDEFKKPYSAMKAATYFSADDVGATAAKEMMNYLLYGTPIPKEVAVKAIIVTKDNYKQVMGKYAD